MHADSLVLYKVRHQRFHLVYNICIKEQNSSSVLKSVRVHTTETEVECAGFRSSSAAMASAETQHSLFFLTFEQHFSQDTKAVGTFVKSTPVSALTETGSSASRRFTSPVTWFLFPLRMTISLVLAKGAATWEAICKCTFMHS